MNGKHPPKITQADPTGTMPWMGETGPSLPDEYAHSVIQAMPCDPNRLFVYWSLTVDDRKALQQVASNEEPWVRALNINDQVIHQVSVDTALSSVYLPLQPTRVFRVQLSLCGRDMKHRVFLTSARLRPVPVYIEPMQKLEPWNPLRPITPMDIPSELFPDLPTSSGNFSDSLED